MKKSLIRFLRAGGIGAALALLATPGLAAHTGGAVPLRGYDNAILDPATSDQPYSPRNTCGTCHDYDEITSAYHFQQGFDEASDTFNPAKPFVKSPGMYGKW